MFVRVRTALRVLQSVGAPYILVGGWAVFAHAPRLPSVDVDVFLPRSAAPVIDHLSGVGLAVGPDREVECLDLDAGIEWWGFGDPDLGIPEPVVHPHAIFEGRTLVRDLPLDPPIRLVTVPTPEALAVSKLVALRNRDLAFQAHGSGEARMLLGPSLVPPVLARSESYYLRKAGKDLLDLALLLMLPGTSEETRAILQAAGLESTALASLQGLSPQVVSWADDAAARLELPAPMRTVQALFGGH